MNIHNKNKSKSLFNIKYLSGDTHKLLLDGIDMCDPLVQKWRLSISHFVLFHSILFPMQNQNKIYQRIVKIHILCTQWKKYPNAQCKFMFLLQIQKRINSSDNDDQMMMMIMKVME